MAETILLVDDDPDITDLLANHLLVRHGYDVLSAPNGEKGLEVALAERPDLIISDLMMPRLNGLDMLEMLHENGLRVPTILLTAHGSESVAVMALRLGVREYITKPFRNDELLEAINRVLREGRLARERDELVQQLIANETKLRRSVQESSYLYEIGKSITGSLDLQKVLNRIVEAAVQLTVAEEGHILRPDESGDMLVVCASKNAHSAAQSMPMQVPTAGSQAGRVLREQEPILVGDADELQQVSDSYFVRSLIYVPLVWQKKSIGVLGVANWARPATFNQDDVRVLTALADYSAIAMHNANAFEVSDHERMRLQAAFQQGQTPIFMINEQRQITLMNEPARQALRVGAEQVVGRQFNDVVGSRPLQLFLKQSLEGIPSQQMELMLTDERVYEVQATAAAGMGRLVMMYDMTAVKNLNQMQVDFVTSISQDLRSPLTAITGYVALLAQEENLNELQYQYIGRIRRSIDQIRNMIGELLDVGQLESSLGIAHRPHQVEQLVREVVSDFETTVSEQDIDVALTLPDHVLPSVSADGNQLRQAFTHLLRNAAQRISNGGRIQVKVREYSGQAIVTVADTGTNLESDDRRTLLGMPTADDLDQDEKENGLQVVRDMIEQHHGRVWVEARDAVGSVVTVVLPTVASPLDGTTAGRLSAY